MITLGLLRAFRNRGIDVVSAKSGPDYIDPAFHQAASGAACVNLDAWAMQPAQLRGLAHGQAGDLLLIEGAMGLFDGAPDAGDPLGRGSVADLAETLSLPVILVLDASKQAQTAAAVVAGLAGFHSGVKIAGVILNQVGSARHKDMLEAAIQTTGVPVLGAIPRTTDLAWPSRHLGLVQAQEDHVLEAFIQKAAALLAANVDLDQLINIAAPIANAPKTAGLPPLGQRIAVARDAAFAFSYPHMLAGWRQAGAEISFFSPLLDQIPDPSADAIFLPGGYPELYAGRLAGNQRFKAAMRAATAVIYGECGGYMMLGEHLTDAKGITHKMLGLLPVSTSFSERKLHLGYRNLTVLAGPLQGQYLKGHEFHYACITAQSNTGHLFAASNSLSNSLDDIGHIRGNVSGSFAHIIC